ncbi:phage terminase large subunit [Clostridium sp. AM34-11AC]|uniref:phage terminase large subunit n=1 Tax=Clostridium sp. AM34-11AC TaxID=2305242 RepID=UPI001FA90CDD|nr:phage terminase large subunit [Clostridium sp. AM34-11AC]
MAKKKAEKPTENASSEHPGTQNLVPVRTKEEARERGRKGGLKSAEVRRQKKTMRDMAKSIMETTVSEQMGNVRDTLARMGLEENDMTYQAAVVVRLIQKAMVEGDTSAIRVLGELTGELNRFGYIEADDPDVIELQYPAILIPENGRDEPKQNVLGPQAGPQTMFMASSADIVIYGGAAGGGKTYALLLEALRHKDVKGFGAVIFRKNFTQITAEGGLWDASTKIFSQVPDAHQRKTPKLHWKFDAGAKLTFAHLDREEDLLAWQGTEIAYLAFDELTHFTKHQFLYMLSRNRSTCGVKPYVRATCNPDSDSWVADFISWWIDQDTGYPIRERSGVVRYMCVLNDVIYWGDSPEDLADKYDIPPTDCKSVTFIASRLEDNKILMTSDPSYLSNLKAMTEVDMERLLYGNWKIKAQAGRYFKRTQVTIIAEAPNDIIMWCRAWDLAATDEDENGDADLTAGVLMGLRKGGTVVVLNVINQRIKAGDVEKLVYNTALIDRQRYGYQYIVRVPQDPGQAGKVLAGQYVKLLSGFNVKTLPVSGSKELRATPFAAQWQNGNVEVLLGDWNEEYFSQLESFPESKHDDMVDASSDSFNELTNNTFDIDALL